MQIHYSSNQLHQQTNTTLSHFVLNNASALNISYCRLGIRYYHGLLAIVVYTQMAWRSMPPEHMNQNDAMAYWQQNTILKSHDIYSIRRVDIRCYHAPLAIVFYTQMTLHSMPREHMNQNDAMAYWH